MSYHRETMIEIPTEELHSLAARWRVRELSLFGSALRDDFSPDSDVDVLVEFVPDAPWTLWDIVRMKSQLEEVFGRRVDLVEKSALRNPYRRKRILATARVVYAA